MDPFEYCILCNPEKNWLELEFRSENDEPIDGLDVQITLDTTGHTYTAKTYDGNVVFGSIPAGMYRVTVSQASLLTEVEKYSSRKEESDSPVKARAESEDDGSGNAKKKYKLVTIGDFWDEAPVNDDFLIEHHNGIDINASDEKAGFCLNHNRTYVFEVKALRSYLPYIVDTDDFSLVNSYTFALLARLAYASQQTDLDDGKTISSQGSIDVVLTQLKQRIVPSSTADIQANWLVEEVPYSHALSSQYYAHKDIGAEGYLLYNNDIVILGVRGTEPYFNNGTSTNKNALWEVVKDTNGMSALVNDVVVGTRTVIGSSGYKDLVETDLDGAQISVELFGGTYVHEGFYRYSMALWEGDSEISLMRDITDHHQGKFFYMCGHSLGAAGATIISALLKETDFTSGLRLFTYGSPRTGTRSFVERYKSIIHHRHVNDHDLVPQVPMRWVNTAEVSDRIYATAMSLITLETQQVITDISHLLVDQDDDNYHHHGQLTQLLTYTEGHQVLLTPRQTHMPILDAIKATDNDSFELLKDIDVNVSIAEQLAEHGMNAYIPNLSHLLKTIFSTSLKEHYDDVLNSLPTIEAKARKQYQKLKMEHASMAGEWHYSEVNKARYWYLQQQIDITSNIIFVLDKIEGELKLIVSDPMLMPTDKLLFANQILPDDIKRQIWEL
ncbi:TPA: lipase [Vibrio parahaemolyticus]|nr:lipase [Vibrio parahaemolyticus]